MGISHLISICPAELTPYPEPSKALAAFPIDPSQAWASALGKAADGRDPKALQNG